MDSLLAVQVYAAADYPDSDSATHTFHYTLPPVAALAQISLSSCWAESAIPATVNATFTSMTTFEHAPVMLSTFPATSALTAINLTELEGELFVFDASATAIVNVFDFALVETMPVPLPTGPFA